VSWYTSVSNWILQKSPISATTVIAPIGKGALTVGDIRSALSGLPALGVALSDIVHGTATLADGETIAEDSLAVASLADPALAPVLSVAAQLLPIVVTLIESGVIKGDPEPFKDAQLTGTHSAR
jgi:hypothetical protein